MSEPMQPAHDGGMKQPPQTSPAPDLGTSKTGGGDDDRSAALDDQEGGMIGEGDDGSDV
jgi:hypothetical protein